MIRSISHLISETSVVLARVIKEPERSHFAERPLDRQPRRSRAHACGPTCPGGQKRGFGGSPTRRCIFQQDRSQFLSDRKRLYTAGGISVRQKETGRASQTGVTPSWQLSTSGCSICTQMALDRVAALPRFLGRSRQLIGPYDHPKVPDTVLERMYLFGQDRRERSSLSLCWAACIP